MMNPEIILITVIALLVVFGFVIFQQYRLLKNNKQLIAQQFEQVNHLQNDFSASCEANRKMGEHLISLEKKLKGVMERQDNLDMREPDLATYKQAITMASDGAGISDLMNTCGLGRTEAELVHLMHQQTADINLKRDRLLS